MKDCVIDMEVLSVGNITEYTPIDTAPSAQMAPEGTPGSPEGARVGKSALPRHLILDDTTLTNLDVTCVGGNPTALNGSLFDRIDFCSTPFGGFFWIFLTLL